MKRLLSHNLPWLSLAAFVAVIAAEGGWLRREQLAARRAEAALGRKLQERDWLAAQTPALSADNEEALRADLERVRQALVAAKAALCRGETGRRVEPAPTESREAYFHIARFVERNRASAHAARVALRPDERFGFAAFVNEGPAGGLLPQVYRQLLVSETLVTHLSESHPLELLAMRREAAGPGQAGARNQAQDHFVMDDALSVRRQGELETVAFQVEFSGQTATLRSFLTTLAALPQPFLVRSVEVGPMPAKVSMANAAETPVPLVRQNLSRFTVVVESVWWGEAPGKTAP